MQDGLEASTHELMQVSDYSETSTELVKVTAGLCGGRTTVFDLALQAAEKPLASSMHASKPQFCWLVTQVRCCLSS